MKRRAQIIWNMHPAEYAARSPCLPDWNGVLMTIYWAEYLLPIGIALLYQSKVTGLGRVSLFEW
uniref:Uncharacterized protein n=1 Tax=Salmonella sp. TaxID=599 RepID=A0A482ET38_SALSP|nr:hypothetical protein NNIBIDOC_00014 [Salmonella sp.]